ncbi:hypothetical protein VTJ49DRAFT_6674 [Mycothermus thermophilus]|uniref:Uncharacterized protein n=1 Tax=Humicola insolens TaxID=85995 RepID=A0ABR3V0Z6_HUMIN
MANISRVTLTQDGVCSLVLATGKATHRAIAACLHLSGAGAAASIIGSGYPAASQDQAMAAGNHISQPSRWVHRSGTRCQRCPRVLSLQRQTASTDDLSSTSVTLLGRRRRPWWDSGL